MGKDGSKAPFTRKLDLGLDSVRIRFRQDSGVAEQRFESEIHVLLDVAVK